MEAAPNSVLQEEGKKKILETLLEKTGSKTQKPKQRLCTAPWEEQAAKIMPGFTSDIPSAGGSEAPTGLRDALQLPTARSLAGPPVGPGIDVTKGHPVLKTHALSVLCLRRFPEASASSRFIA